MAVNTEMGKEFVFYLRPKSASFGHSANVKDLRKAWLKTMAFLVKHTSFKLVEPFTFDFYQAQYLRSVDSSGSLAAELIETFDNPLEGSESVFRWNLNGEHLDKAINFAIQYNVYKSFDVGPIWIYLTFQFLWSDCQNDVEIFINRSNLSSLSVIFNKNVFLQPRFIIPYKLKTNEFESMIKNISNDLPFKFDQKSLRPAITKENKLGYSYVRVSA